MAARLITSVTSGSKERLRRIVRNSMTASFVKGFKR
jgi:hypothetical protein